MTSPTPYLECVVLASSAYPSGISHALFAGLWARSPRVSTRTLTTLLIPYAAVLPAVWFLRPALVSGRGASGRLLLLAALTVPVAFLVEYVVHGLSAWHVSGRWPRLVGVHGFWAGRLSPLDHGLVMLIAIGEELFFRSIWMGALLAWGLPAAAALAISSVAYGLNHLAFGGTAVAAKAGTGVLYGALYLAAGHSVVPSIVAHLLQNLALLARAGLRHD